MKKSLLLMTLLLSFISYSQENRFTPLFEEAEAAIDKEFDLSTKEGMVLVQGSENQITTNHPYLEENLREWKHGAEFSQANYRPIFREIKAIKYISLPMDQYWAVTKNNEIYINSRFVEFRNLTRVMVWQALGHYFYGLEFEENGRFIMSETWKLNPEYENWAYQHAKRPNQRKAYFEKLAAKWPLEFYKKI